MSEREMAGRGQNPLLADSFKEMTKNAPAYEPVEPTIPARLSPLHPLPQVEDG
jgi:hypothetical protein